MATTTEHDGTLAFRVAALEKEQEMQRQRIHTLVNEQNALRLIVQRNTDAIETLSEAVNGLRKAVVQVGVGIVGSAIVFAFTVLLIFGRT